MRRGEIVAFCKERTGILHVRIEHRFEKIVAQIVMHPADFSGAPESLLVRDKSGEKCPDVGKSKFETFLESGTNGVATRRIERVAVPRAIHVGFTETERPRSKDSTKETPVMHVDVPGTLAVDANVRAREQISHHIMGSGHIIWPVAGALRLSLKNRARYGDYFYREKRADV